MAAPARSSAPGEEPGTPLRLSAGSTWAEVHPTLGGRLGQLDLGEGPLLRGPAPGLGWMAWGCYPLLPWSNRIPGGHLRWGALAADLPVTHVDGSAIHGLAADRPWSVRDLTADRLALTIDVCEGPYDVRGHLTYALGPGVLRIALEVANRGEVTVPVGLGIHPWFPAGEVRIPADAVWPGEPLPTGPPVPVQGRHDLRHGTVPEPMDACFTVLTGTGVDVPGARLDWDGPVTQAVVYSGEPGWVCVEPVTMATDGIAMAERGEPGHGVRALAPGESLAVRYRFSPALHPSRPDASHG